MGSLCLWKKKKVKTMSKQCLSHERRTLILDSFNEALESLQGFNAHKETIKFVEQGENEVAKTHICKKFKR